MSINDALVLYDAIKPYLVQGKEGQALAALVDLDRLSETAPAAASEAPPAVATDAPVSIPSDIPNTPRGRADVRMGRRGKP